MWKSKPQKSRNACNKLFCKSFYIFVCFWHGSKDSVLSRHFCFNPKQLRQVQKNLNVLDLYKDKAKIVSSLTICKCWLFCINPKKRKHFCCTSHMMEICQGICSQVCLRLFFRLMDYQMLVLMLFTVCLNLDYWLEALSHRYPNK